MPREEREAVPCVSILAARTAGARTAGARTTGARTAGERTAGARPAGGRTAGARTARARTARARTARARTADGGRTDGGRTDGGSHARRARGGTRASSASAGRRQYASNTRVVLFAVTRRQVVDGMFKIVYICWAPVLGNSVPKAFPRHSLGKKLAQKKNLLGQVKPTSQNLGKTVLG
jgi:hypothetical protein